MVYVIYVTYGFVDNDIFTALKKIIPLNKDGLIIVDTASQKKLASGDDINVAYDFSGYQYGLEQVLKKSNNEEIIRAIFINDTFFLSHLVILRYLILRKIFRRITSLQKNIIGYSKKCEEIRDFNEYNFYYPSFIFGISAPIELFQKINFYKDLAMQDDFAKNLSPEYLKMLDLWLQPRNLFYGWYKASPYKKTPKDVYIRKTKAIRLEHGMLGVLKKVGIEPFNINDSHSVLLAAFIDRIYLIIIKIIHRCISK